MRKEFSIQYKRPNTEIAAVEKTEHGNKLETHKRGSLERSRLRRDLGAEPRGGSTRQHVKLHVTRGSAARRGKLSRTTA